MKIFDSRPALDPNARLTLAILACLVSLGPLSIDMYLPAMPAMARALATDTAHIHLTMSAYLWGFSIFHLACGPLADRFGRRPLLLGGMGLFVLASIGCARAVTVEELTAYRFIQGIGACVGPTLARTITRDVFGPRGAARALSLIAMIMALAPAIAPGLGGILLRYLPWPVLFIFLAAYGGVVFYVILRHIPETLPAPQSLRPARIVANYLVLLRDPVFLPVAIASAMVFSGLMAYLSSSGFVFINMLGVPVEYFGLIFLTSVIGYMAGSALSARLATKYEPARMMLAGGSLAFIATLLMLLFHLLAPTSVIALVLPMTLFSAAMGITLPHSMALAMEHFPHIAATNAALFGFLQMGLSAAITAGVGTILGSTPLPMILVMVATQMVAIALIMLGERRHRRIPTPDQEETSPP